MRQKLGILKVLRRGLKTCEREEMGWMRFRWIFGGQNHVPCSFPRECFSAWWGKGSADLPLALSALQGEEHPELSLARGLVAQMIPRCHPRSVPVAVAAWGPGFALLWGCQTHRGAQPGLGTAGQRWSSAGRAVPVLQMSPLSPALSPRHGALFSAEVFWLKWLLMAGPVGALRLTMGREPPGCKSRNLPAFDGLVGRNLGLQRTL